MTPTSRGCRYGKRLEVTVPATRVGKEVLSLRIPTDEDNEGWVGLARNCFLMLKTENYAVVSKTEACKDTQTNFPDKREDFGEGKKSKDNLGEVALKLMEVEVKERGGS